MTYLKYPVEEFRLPTDDNVRNETYSGKMVLVINNTAKAKQDIYNFIYEPDENSRPMIKSSETYTQNSENKSAKSNTNTKSAAKSESAAQKSSTTKKSEQTTSQKNSSTEASQAAKSEATAANNGTNNSQSAKKSSLDTKKSTDASATAA